MKQTEDSDIERSPEYYAFIETLIDYHKKRGTHLQKEPSLGPRRISLLKLYKKIIGYGGYDKVSDTPLMWRRIADEYGVPPMSNAGMPAYILKSVYYKNLAAFEIERHHGRVAPPPELLEHQTARGGAITSRPDIINPPPPKTIQEQSQQKQQRSTPQPRQAYVAPPVQQPLIQSSEYVRPSALPDYVRPVYPITAGQYHSHSLHDSATNNIHPLVLRTLVDQHNQIDVTTPSTTPTSLHKAALALKSGLHSEVAAATQHLVKASYELADDLMLEKVNTLTETLLEVVKAGIAHLSKFSMQVNGTKRIKLQHEQVDLETNKALDAALVLRNVTLQQDNAKYVARLPVATQIILAGLQLPSQGKCVEMRQYCIEICDSLLPSISALTDEINLYHEFVRMLDSPDRCEILLGLRGLIRFSITDEQDQLMQDIEVSTMSRLCTYIHLDDRELLTALVSFFFQYTTYTNNVKAITKLEGSIDLLRRLHGLMMWQAELKSEEVVLDDANEPRKQEIPSNPPVLPDEIVRELLTFPEPDRAIHWMRACFEEDKDQSVTQILLWQSYRTLFTPYSLPSQNGQAQGKPLLQAADVIKMVGNAFTGATAMVINSPNEGQKFIIRGIKCRLHPQTPSGKSYISCKWQEPDSPACGAPLASGKDLYTHLIEKHIKPATLPMRCHYDGCHRFDAGESNMRILAKHMMTHDPDSSPPIIKPSKPALMIYSERTLMSDGEPRGLASTAALTIRNIAHSDPSILEQAGIGFIEALIDTATRNPAISSLSFDVLSRVVP